MENSIHLQKFREIPQIPNSLKNTPSPPLIITTTHHTLHTTHYTLQTTHYTPQNRSEPKSQSPAFNAFTSFSERNRSINNMSAQIISRFLLPGVFFALSVTLTSNACNADQSPPPVVVPDYECTIPIDTSGIFNANCPIHAFVCTASFEGFTITSHGEPGPNLQSSALNCDYCNQCNPSMGNPMGKTCLATLSVTFTEETTVSRSYGVESGTLSAAWLKAQAGAAFGCSESFSVTFSAMCGDSNHDPCEVVRYYASLGTLEGLVAEAPVTFSWTGTKNGYPADPGCPAVTTTGIFFQDGGSSIITATGKKAGIGCCTSSSPEPCP